MAFIEKINPDVPEGRLLIRSSSPITNERSEWRNLFKDVSTTLDMTGVK